MPSGCRRLLVEVPRFQGGTSLCVFDPLGFLFRINGPRRKKLRPSFLPLHKLQPFIFIEHWDNPSPLHLANRNVAPLELAIRSLEIDRIIGPRYWPQAVTKFLHQWASRTSLKPARPAIASMCSTVSAALAIGFPSRRNSTRWIAGHSGSVHSE
jgi:hypothetical protein